MRHTRTAILTRSFQQAFWRCLVLVVAGAILGAAAHADTTTNGQRKVTLQLRWHHQFQFAGYYMAKHLGYYREAGLAVDIRPGGRGISPIAEVVAGNADFGIDGSGLLVERENGIDLVAIAALFQKSPLRLITRADAGIRDLRDLAGRRVMLLPGFRSLALVAMLDQVALLDEITRVDSSADIHDLVVGNVDAFNGYDSNEPFVLERQQIGFHQFDPAAYGIQFYGDVLFTAGQTLATDHDLVARFRDASLRGWMYALEHPERTIAVIREHYAPNRSLAHLRFEAKAVRDSMMADVVEIGHMSQLRWTKIRDQLAALGLVSHDLPIGPFLYQPSNSDLDWPRLQPYVFGAVAALAVLLALAAFVMRKNLRLREEIETRMQAEQRAHYLATHDYLTGLPNRMMLMDRLTNALARARRRGETPMLAFIDLDSFKQLNDTQGHQRGDELLVNVAREVTAVAREEDTFARMGGDEFVLLLDHMRPELAINEAERLMQAMQRALQAFTSGNDLGASIGILSIAQPQDLTAEHALQLADALMYEVKREGKHSFRVSVYGDTPDDTRGAAVESERPPARSQHVNG